MRNALILFATCLACSCSLLLDPSQCSGDDDCDGAKCVEGICRVDEPAAVDADASDGSDAASVADAVDAAAAVDASDVAPSSDVAAPSGDATIADGGSIVRDAARPHDADGPGPGRIDARVVAGSARRPRCAFVSPPPIEANWTRETTWSLDVEVTDLDTAPDDLRVRIDGQRVDLEADGHYRRPDFPLRATDGEHRIDLRATDDTSLTCESIGRVLVDRTAPIITVTDPPGGQTTIADCRHRICLHFDDAGPMADLDVLIGGDAVPQRDLEVHGSEICFDAELAPGLNGITISGADAAGNRTARFTRVFIECDIVSPIVELEAPEPGARFVEPVTNVVGTVIEDGELDLVGVDVRVDELQPRGAARRLELGPFGVDDTGAFDIPIELFVGPNRVTVCARDRAANRRCTSVEVELSDESPTIRIETPAEGAAAPLRTVEVTGVVGGNASRVELQVGDDLFPAAIDEETRRFSGSVRVPGAGVHRIRARVFGRDDRGEDTAQVEVYYDDTGPIVGVSSPAEGVCVSALEITVCGTAIDPHTPITRSSLNGRPFNIAPDGGFCSAVRVGEGPRRSLTVEVDNAGGRSTRVIRSIDIDRTPPTLEIEAPPADTFVGVDERGAIRFAGRATDALCGIPLGGVIVNGESILVDTEDRFDLDLVLPSGPTTVEIDLLDTVGNDAVAEHEFFIDADPPRIEDVDPPGFFAAREETLRIRARVYDPESGLASVTIGDVEVVPDPEDGVFLDVELADGRNELDIVAVDRAGGRTVVPIAVFRDLEVPSITITFPPDAASIGTPVAIVGTMTDNEGGSGVASVRVNGIEATLDPQNGTWALAGWTPEQTAIEITVEAADAAGNPAAPLTVTATMADFGTNDPLAEGLAGVTDVRWLGAANLDGDNLIDLVALSGETGPSAVFLQRPDGRFIALIGGASGIPDDIDVIEAEFADFNGDGAIDLVYGGNDEAGLLLGQGDGRFVRAQAAFPNIASGAKVRSLTASDFNRDGRADVLILARSRSRVLYGFGDGTFATQTFEALGLDGLDEMQNVRAIDWTRDQIDDIAAVGALVSGFWRGRPDGTFVRATVTDGWLDLPSRRISILDADADGDLDVLVFGVTTGVFRNEGLADGRTWVPAGLNLAQGPGERGMAVGDLNGDGRDDLVAWGAAGLVPWVAGAGGFQRVGAAVAGLPELTDVRHALIVDIDGDADGDVLAATPEGVVLTRSNATVTLAPQRAAWVRARRRSPGMAGPGDGLGAVVYQRFGAEPRFGRAVPVAPGRTLRLPMGTAEDTSISVRYTDLGQAAEARSAADQLRPGDWIEVDAPARALPPLTVEGREEPGLDALAPIADVGPDAVPPDIPIPDAPPDVLIVDAIIPDVVRPDAVWDAEPPDAEPFDVLPEPDAYPFEPPVGEPGPRQNLVVFTRGLPLNRIIGNINLRFGGSIWIVDPDVPGSERELLDEDEVSANLMPAWSPNKQFIVWASNRNKDFERDPTPNLDLWIADINGENRRRLTRRKGHEWTPSWSHDGQRIAYASTTNALFNRDSADELDIWIINGDGTQERQLFDGGAQDEDPVFSADDSLLYFVAVTAGVCPRQVWQVNVDIGQDSAEPLIDGAGEPICGEDISLGPDGVTLYFADGNTFRSVNLQTGERRNLGFAIEPWVGPAGNRAVFVDGNLNMMVRDLTTMGDTQVTNSFNDFFPRWAP